MISHVISRVFARDTICMSTTMALFSAPTSARDVVQRDCQLENRWTTPRHSANNEKNAIHRSSTITLSRSAQRLNRQENKGEIVSEAPAPRARNSEPHRYNRTR